MIILDSDVLIDLVRKTEPSLSSARRFWEEGEHLGTTSVNVAEVLRGARGDRERLRRTVDVLDGLTQLSFEAQDAHRFGRIMGQLDRQGESAPVVDGLIASIVLERGARLLTRNTRDFEKIPGLEIVQPSSAER